MSHLITVQPNKPNRKTLDPKYNGSKDKSAEYHLDNGKWALTNAFSTAHNKWLASVSINKRFYKGDQWITREDTESFLKDDTNQEKNRIKIVHNLIRPMIEQYRGNSIILNINATAQSISKKAINRREQALAKQVLKTRVANEFPALGNIIKSKDKTLGDSVKETTQIFDNLYQDQYVRKMNLLLKYVNNLNQFQEMQVKLSQNVGLTGLGVTLGYEHGGHLRFEVVESEDFFFDRNAKKYDLTDAAYMGRRKLMDPAVIFERWQRASDGHREAIERYVSTETTHSESNVSHENSKSALSSGRVPVYETYWRDFDKFTYGWVLDKHGYPYLTRIDYTPEGEDKPEFTKADLIDPPDSRKNRILFPKGNKTREMYVDILRFCTFIPGELISTHANELEGVKEKVSDITLDWGKVAYQERDLLDPASVRFPFKAYCWGYIDGEIFSPVDDAINPQRFINRILSVTESQINNSGGRNVIIDEDTLPAGEKGAAYRDIAQGKPVTIKTKGRGVPNSIGVYDATPGQGTYKMFEAIPFMKQLIQDTTGVNEALKGESIGQDQLVGVTQSQIQRGSLMQEPFYNTLTRIFVQMNQHTATVGKNLYIDNERELAIAVGDDGVEILELSEDMRSEDFRVFIKRENSEEALEQQANQMIMLFFEIQMLDQNKVADLYNRSTPQEVMMAVRESMGQRAEAQRRDSIAQQEQIQSAQQAEGEQIQAAQQEQIRQEGLLQQKDIKDKDHEIDKILTKGIVDMSKENAKNNTAV